MKMRLASLATAILLISQLPLLAQSSGKAKQKDEKPNIIQIDPSTLPPELAKALLEFAQKQKSTAAPAKNKGGADAISLAEAIGIAEKAGKGRATSADRKDGLDYTHFNVNVVHADGTRTRYTLGATGNILQQRKGSKDRD